MFHPSRGGVRGGKDQFKWDDVKDDKFRENFLGHSVMAPVGRWQKGKDLTWYAKNKGTAPGGPTAQQEEDQRRQELQRVKEEEEAAMMEMLGLKPKRRHQPTGGAGALGKSESEALFKKGKAGESLGQQLAEGERIKGLGFGSRGQGRNTPQPNETQEANEVEASGKKGGVEEDESPKEPVPSSGGDKGHSAGVAKGERGSGKPSEGAQDHGERSRRSSREQSRGDKVHSGDDQSSGSESDSGSDSDSKEGSDGEHRSSKNKDDKGKETRMEKKGRKRREKRQESRRKRKEEELSGAKGVSEKRLKRRRKEMRLERKKQRREERKKRADGGSTEKGQALSPKGEDEGRSRTPARGKSFEDMFKSGQLLADREGFVKERKHELKDLRRSVEEDHDRRRF